MEGGTLTSAANGSVPALLRMADEAHEAGDGEAFIPSLVCLVEALTFTRLAAAGGSSNAKRHVVSLLSDLSDLLASAGEDHATSFAAQALALANQFADEGDDSLADFVAVRGDGSSEETLALAKSWLTDARVS